MYRDWTGIAFPSTMVTKNKYYSLVALLLFIYESSTRQVYGLTVKRFEDSDKFDNPKCIKGCNANDCSDFSKNCHDAGGKMYCEVCCICLCNGEKVGSTFVGFLAKCVKNKELPSVFGYKLTDYDFRLVTAESDGKSCEKQRAPVLNLKNPGSKTLAMCPGFGMRSSSHMTQITSCSAVAGEFKYYSGGYWREVWQNGSALPFAFKYKTKGVTIQWSEGRDQKFYQGRIFSVIVRCSLHNKTTDQLFGLLLFKSSGSSNASTEPPVLLNTTLSLKVSSKPTSSSVPLTNLEITTESTSSNVTEASIELTTNSATTSTTADTDSSLNSTGHKHNGEGFRYSTVLLAVIGGGASTFLFMVVACVILMCVRKQRRELELERSMSDKDNPVYGKGVSSTLELKDRESTSLTSSLPREEPLLYQPLVENTRPRGATWGQQVYQSLATQRYSDIAVSNGSVIGTKDIPRCSTLGRYDSSSKETNGFYQPLIMHKPGLPCNKPHIDHDYQECGDDGYEEPPVEKPSTNTGNSDEFLRRSNRADRKGVPPYLEAGCVIKTQTANDTIGKNFQNMKSQVDANDIDENDFDSGKTMLDRQGRPFEPMYHVLEGPGLAISDTL